MLSYKQVKALVPRVKRNAFDKVRIVAFCNDGTIFGGAVREDLIAEYYTNKLIKEEGGNIPANRPGRFWDANYMPHTKARLLVPDDIDLSFRTVADADKFIQQIREVKEFSSIEVNDVTNENKYYMNGIQSIREVIIELDVLSNLLYENQKVSIKIDVIVGKHKDVQPPFRNLDMLCNGFIERRDTGKVFSRHTGTIIDRYSDYERSMVVCQILKDMMDFKTVLCFTTSYPQARFTRNLIAMKRIEKMQNKRVGWSFMNMPFETKLYREVNTDENQVTECAICTKSFQADDKIAYTTSTKDDKVISCPYMHYKCCMKHLNYQAKQAPTYHREVFVFRCPFRNIITFSRCALDIQFIYKIDM